MKEFFKKFYLALVFLFLYGPIAVLMVFSFNDSRLKGSWVAFTFKWYKELLHNEEILSSFKTTILIAILATIIATILGTIAAIGIYYLRGYKKTLL
ncbi:MAG: ABC transporter permease, partial [Finegoldia magna]|nr:ABC transporter permease [Finegoldia magna]